MNKRFNVQNMKCEGCVTTVRDALQALEGCEKADVGLETGIAEVFGDVDGQRVEAVLTEIGFPGTEVG